MNAPQLEAEDLEKVYGSGENRFRALKGVSLSARTGDSLAIVGRSGSGKSTLLHLLGALDRPDGGRVRYEGEPVDTMSTRDQDRMRNREFGFVFQQFHLEERASVLENVALPMMIAKVPAKERRERALEVLDRLGLADRADENAANLSGGQRQRVAMARALANRPRVIFADEPTGALDVENGATVADLLFELNRDDGITLVLITHSTDLARRCGRRVTIVDGELAPDDPAATEPVR
ncbi:ABC transporter ATP-binding protein [Phycicoccus flavus]|uniref:ABC transporter ATP-binding protein n=1 Tax=Phycicoccus flavus TaxID=2502783 RepID=UPI000FEBB178|nr:ABC transporter ATP-binding protein [Phycicoccus flavus]NHA66993.1 ABC transporter ATP-binding protein [Phycicoccus flavus]